MLLGRIRASLQLVKRFPKIFGVLEDVKKVSWWISVDFPTTRAVIAGQRCGTGPCSPAAGPVQHPQALCLCPPQLGLAVLLSISPVPRALICVVFVGQGSLFLPAVTNSWVKLLLSALALPSCCVQLRPFLVYLRPLSNDVSLSLSLLYFLPSHREKETWLLLPISYLKFLDLRFFHVRLVPKAVETYTLSDVTARMLSAWNENQQTVCLSFFHLLKVICYFPRSFLNRLFQTKLSFLPYKEYNRVRVRRQTR